MLDQFTYGKTFCALEHNTFDGEEVINGLILSKKKKELVFDSSFEVDNIEKLSDHIIPKQHLFIIINTGKVLFKKLNGQIASLQAVQQAFPNLQLEDFYYETYASNDKTFVAICRKEDVNELLAMYEQKQYAVIGFSLGNLSIANLTHFVHEQALTTSNATIQFGGRKILDLSINNPNKENSTINGLDLSSTSILPLAGIISYYAGTSKTSSNFDSVSTELKQKFKQQHVFNLGLKISLATIFVLLLFNFFQFTNYTTKIEDLTTTLAVNKTQKTALLKLTNEVQKKEKLIKDFSLASSKASWYLDLLGASVPPSVTLSEIQWQPLTKSIKEDTPIQTYQQSIMIKGISNKGDNFSTWLSSLEQLEWVEKLSINDYGLGKKASTSFELEIAFQR